MSVSIYAELVAAGAPQLPGDYKYRITTHPLTGNHPWVQIIKPRRWWLWDKVVGESWAADATTVRDLAFLCGRSYAKAGIDETPDSLARFFGTHP